MLKKEDFIAKANIVHSGKYDYSDIEYKNTHTKIVIKCPIHGDFEQMPYSHLKGHGCPFCAKNEVSAKKTMTSDDFIKKAVEIHGDKYDYSKVTYERTDKKVCIICPVHGEFWQTPNAHLQGKGCLKCARENDSKLKKNTTENFIAKAKVIHNDFYDYSKTEYKGGYKDLVSIICPKHGEFQQTPDKHLQGHGCPKCAKQISKYEDEIYNHLKEFGLNVIRRERSLLDGKEIDIYLPDYKLGIEFNGLRWHSELFQKDKNYHLNKLIECNKKGVRLIQIFEDEYLKNKELILKKIDYILGFNKKFPQKIYARKCEVLEISSKEAETFLNKNHIQGFVKSSSYLGCFYKGSIIAVMSFTEEQKNKWNLTRFSSDNDFLIVGVAGKILSYFIEKYNPEEIKSFADRRWTLKGDNNLYVKLGFTLSKILPPDYRYYQPNKFGLERIHKFRFRKEKLMKEYGFTEDLTEKEMCDKIGAYRIYDCGLFRYEWKKKESD